MPALKNAKHERYARELVAGIKLGRSQGGSYAAAGYQVTGQVAESAASRLLKNVKTGVAARVRELTGGGAQRAKITAQGLLERLDVVFDGAVDAKQYSAAGRAAEAQAKIAGVGAAERIEIGGPGAFAPSTVDDVVDRMIVDLGDPASALIEAEQVYLAIRAGLEARAAAHATVIAPALQPGDGEAARGIELFRPTRKGGR